MIKDIVIETGEVGRELYFLREGKCNVQQNKVCINVCHAPVLIGEISILRKKHRTADIIAVDFCIANSLSRDEWYEFINKFPNEEIKISLHIDYHQI